MPGRVKPAGRMELSSHPIFVTPRVPPPGSRCAGRGTPIAWLIRDAGFEPVDAGPLRIARYTEPFALLMGQLAYEGVEGPALAYRFERFEN